MKCPKCQFENPENTYYCGKCATQIRPLEGEVFSRTMTLGTPFKVMTEGTIFAGKYRIIGELGRGGMGIVYKAEDTKLKRIVALKFLPPELSLHPESLERFVREAQAAAVLDHPHICSVYEVEEAEGMTYIAMAFIEGESLREKIIKKPRGVDEAVEIAAQVAEGLEAAHKRGIIHRDIKSGNIMVRGDGQAKIMDFGLAKVMGESLITREARTMGTVAYMSPEQARGEELDHRTDLWSLGVVLYEMLTGELPFRGERDTSLMYAIVHEEPRPIEKLKPGIPIEIIKIIERALKKDRNVRYSSAVEMARDLRSYQEAVRAEAAGIFNLRSLLKRIRRPRVAIAAALSVVVIALLAFWFFDRQAKIRWARQKALPEIKAFSALMDWPEAGFTWDQKASMEIFDLGKKAARYISGDSEFKKFWPKCFSHVSFQTNPPGAKIFVKAYASSDDNWRFLGLSPLENAEMPFGYFRWRVEKEGFEPEVFVAASLQMVEEVDNTWAIKDKKILRVLDKIGTIPSGMVHVRAQKIQVAEKEVELPDFYVDKYEVTNREFKEFVTRGGYKTRDFWKNEFYKGGKRLSWEEAMAEFVDETGIPGPATWRGGDYPEGKGEYPVSGISWYEAAAYAEFRGKSLPTIHHWDIATALQEGMGIGGLGAHHQMMSNFLGKGPLPAANEAPMAASGACQMAGNVREWCWNESVQGRIIRGGAWDDPTYMFITVSQADPFDRSEKNGVRCIKDIDPQKVPAEVFAPFAAAAKFRDYKVEKPVSDEVFRVYRDIYDYDKKLLDAVVEERDESNENWVKERIIFNAAYSDDNIIYDSKRMPAYLFLPKNTPPPYQVVIYFPAAGPFPHTSRGEIEKRDFKRFDFIVKNGRALMFPVYLFTYERQLKIPIYLDTYSKDYVQYTVRLVQDCRRSIDYLETRKDIDIDKLAFFGWSLGVTNGRYILAVEDRIKAGVFLLGGLNTFLWFKPEADPINFVPRIKIPILMLNGKYDTIYPYEITVKPMFDLLGTPPQDKFLKLFDTDHGIPVGEVIKEMQPFLNKYLGPVK